MEVNRGQTLKIIMGLWEFLIESVRNLKKGFNNATSPNVIVGDERCDKNFSAAEKNINFYSSQGVGARTTTVKDINLNNNPKPPKESDLEVTDEEPDFEQE